MSARLLYPWTNFVFPFASPVHQSIRRPDWKLVLPELVEATEALVSHSHYFPLKYLYWNFGYDLSLSTYKWLFIFFRSKMKIFVVNLKLLIKTFLRYFSIHQANVDTLRAIWHFYLQHVIIEAYLSALAPSSWSVCSPIRGQTLSVSIHRSHAYTNKCIRSLIIRFRPWGLRACECKSECPIWSMNTHRKKNQFHFFFCGQRTRPCQCNKLALRPFRNVWSILIWLRKSPPDRVGLPALLSCLCSSSIFYSFAMNC